MVREVVGRRSPVVGPEDRLGLLTDYRLPLTAYIEGTDMNRYQDLRVYQRALELVAAVYRVTASWPADERFGLTSQVRRAATSIVLNIAEGAGAGSDPEFGRFLRFSLRSKYELMAALDIAVRISLTSEEEAALVRTAAEEVASMLVGLMRSLES